jgi:hypothetical protein
MNAIGARYIFLQSRVALPDSKPGKTPISVFFTYGKLSSSLSQLMRQVPNKLLYTKY